MNLPDEKREAVAEVVARALDVEGMTAPVPLEDHIADALAPLLAGWLADAYERGVNDTFATDGALLRARAEGEARVRARVEALADECTYRSDGTDATYCGRPAADHDHHPNCYQSTGEIPDDLPDDLCDCRILRAFQNPLIGPDGFTRLAGNRVIPSRDPDDLCLTCGATNGVCRCPISPAVTEEER